MLLIGLGLFGLITAPAKASSVTGTISAASLEVGPIATLIGLLGTKFGIAITGIVAAASLSLTLENVLFIAVIAFLSLVFLIILSLAALYSR